MRKSYTRTIEDRIKISERSKARWKNPEFKKMVSEKIKNSHVSWNKGMKMLFKYPNWGMVGKKHSKEWWDKNGDKFTRKGKKASPETIEKLRESHRGPRHYAWNGGKLSLKGRIRRLKETTIWRNSVKTRDDNKCIKCFSSSDLHVDHIVSLHTLYEEFLNHYNQFSPTEDKETLVRLSMCWKKFWDVNNGRTLCARCHRDR